MELKDKIIETLRKTIVSFPETDYGAPADAILSLFEQPSTPVIAKGIKRKISEFLQRELRDDTTEMLCDLLAKEIYNIFATQLSQPSAPVSTEEVLEKYWSRSGQLKTNVLKAMEEYHRLASQSQSKPSDLREELVKFVEWFEEAECSKSFRFAESHEIIDIYLKANSYGNT